MDDKEFEKLKLMRKVKKNGECWIFTGCLNGKNGKGYGLTSYQKKRIVAHRLSYILHKGDIPPGMSVLHNCPGGDNRACINPDHLWIGTYKDNAIDACKKGRMIPIWGRKKTQEEKDKIQRNRKIPDQKGVKQHRAILDDHKVLEIRRLLMEKTKYREISEKFGIAIRSVADIKFRRTWKHI